MMGLTAAPPVTLCTKENAAMKTYPRDVEPGVDSQLVDLSEVPLAVLRELDGAAMRRSLVHVVEKARHTQVISAHSNRIG